MKTIPYNSYEKLCTQYYELGGDVIVLDEGCLVPGLTVLTGAEGYKSYIFREVYVNEWSSALSVRGYNKLPAKYEKMIDELYA